MTEDQTALTVDQRQKLADWINRHSKNAHCPVCMSVNWAVGEHLISGNVCSPAGGLMLGGISYPQAFVVCQTCSYVRHFMAMPIGLLNQPPASKEEGKNG